jgi:hypothetical protein
VKQPVWTHEPNPSKLSDFYWWADEASSRKFYSFIAELGHRLRHLMTDPGPIKMIDLCERCAEGQLSENDLGDMAESHRPETDARYAHQLVNQLYWNVADRYKVNVDGVGLAIEAFAVEALMEAGVLPSDERFYDSRLIREHPISAPVLNRTQLEWGSLVRDIYGPNPFHPVVFDPAWKTSTAIGLASHMYESRVFDRMPILADSLEDAGCDNPDILRHCRGDGPHVRGCWVVDLVLGKSEGTLPVGGA